MGTRRPPAQPPAEQLLEALGPADGVRDLEKLGDFGMPARAFMEDMLEPHAKASSFSRMGPLEKVHAFWFAGMSCAGCTVSVTGATAPSVETLLLGAHPGLPRIILHHPVVNVESGPSYLRAHEMALNGELDAPYVIILEGSATDETRAVGDGGYWSAQGEEPWGPDGEERTVTAAFPARRRRASPPRPCTGDTPRPAGPCSTGSSGIGRPTVWSLAMWRRWLLTPAWP